jgi:hypothetical protein
MRNREQMERKYAEIDRKANQLQDSIKQATTRASKEYSKVYDKISTRYNY